MSALSHFPSRMAFFSSSNGHVWTILPPSLIRANRTRDGPSGPLDSPRTWAVSCQPTGYWCWDRKRVMEPGLGWVMSISTEKQGMLNNQGWEENRPAKRSRLRSQRAAKTGMTLIADVSPRTGLGACVAWLHHQEIAACGSKNSLPGAVLCRFLLLATKKPLLALWYGLPW